MAEENSFSVSTRSVTADNPERTSSWRISSASASESSSMRTRTGFVTGRETDSTANTSPTRLFGAARNRCALALITQHFKMVLRLSLNCTMLYFDMQLGTKAELDGYAKLHYAVLCYSVDVDR